MMLLPLSNHLNPPFDTFDYKTKYRTFDYKTIQCKIHHMWSLLNSLKLTQTWKHLDHLKFKPAVSRHCPLDGYGLRTKKLSASISLIYYLLHLPDEVKNKKNLNHQIYCQCTRDLKFKAAVWRHCHLNGCILSICRLWTKRLFVNISLIYHSLCPVNANHIF